MLFVVLGPLAENVSAMV